jgi:serine/threonine protein kinase
MSGDTCPECGNELSGDGRCIVCAPTRELPGPGSTLVGERYRLKRLLGAGGMGEVWLAEDLRLETEVAVKFIAPHMAADESARRRFFREILIARQVRHPNVAAVYELQEEGDRRFFTMEYIPGKTLADAEIAKRDLDTIVSIAADVCRGLAALHQAGIVHRDVKPHNIKLKPDGQAVLLDMGIARGPGSDVTATGWVVGTPNHMAPEQAAGRAVSPATDIYGVGLVLYRLLAGGGALLQREQSNALLPPPSTHNPEVPEWLDRVVMACIHPDPKRRYQDASGLLLDIEARCKSATGTTVTVTRHALAGAGVGLAVLLAVAAATGIWLWSRSHSPQSFEPQRLTYRSGLQSGGVLSPDGRQVTFAASDEEGSFDLFLATVGYPGEIALTRTPETNELQPALSWDGAQLAFVAHGRQTRIGLMPATGGSVRWLTAVGYRPRWSPDDQSLVLQTSHTEPPPQDVLVHWLNGSRSDLSLRRAFALEHPVHSPDWYSATEVLAVLGDREIWRFDLRRQRQEQMLVLEAPVKDLAVDHVRGEVAFLVEGGDGWRPHLWRPGATPRPIAGGGFSELSWFRSGAILLTRAEPEMVIVDAAMESQGRSIVSGQQIVAASSGRPGQDSREFMPDLSPDGNFLAFISSRTGAWELWLKNFGDGSLRQITDQGAENRWPVFSRDSRRLAFCSLAEGNGDILVMDLDSGSITNVSRRSEYVGAPDWFPVGNALAVNIRFSAEDGTNIWNLARIELSSGELTLLTDDPAMDIDPAVSPDGTRIAFSRDQVLHLLDLASGDLHALVPGAAPRWTADGGSLLYQADGDLFRLDLAREPLAPERLTFHPWPARRLEGEWRFSLRGNRLVYSLITHPRGPVVMLSPETRPTS